MKLGFTKTVIALAFPLFAFGQSIVNTSPENKKVVLEEFTGIYCVYCPDGHARAQALKNGNPDNVFLINIHQGGYAVPSGNAPDFRTPYGNAIVSQAQISGYPSGTINRHYFPSLSMYGGTGMGRAEWATAANQILNQPSYVNVAMEAEVDYQTREMTIHVEAYYTADSPESTNLLNVVLLQDNTLGPQTGGNMGNNYVHMHRLVDMVTGQWGEEITTTTEGSFIDRTITYTIPEDRNGIPIEMGELELIVFITETHQEIISGNGYFPSYYNLPAENDAAIIGISDVPESCGVAHAEIEIQSLGSNPITSLPITYSVNGGEPQTYVWEGNLGGLQKTTITLPGIIHETAEVNTIEITLADDENNDNNTITATFQNAKHGEGNMRLELKTDAYGAETSWDIRNSAGEVVQSGSGYANGQLYVIDLELPADDCYQYNIYDSAGDGGARSIIKDSTNTILFVITSNSYSSHASSNFSADKSMGLNELTAESVQIYPNPTTGILNLDLKNNAKVDVMDMTGKRVKTLNAVTGVNQIDLSGNAKGVYILRVNDGKSTTTHKVVVK